MEQEAECWSTRIIDEDGNFDAAELDKFVKQVKLEECAESYVVVSIMGQQSSGKSTLVNHLFGTDFKEMDANEGRSRTTKGIWVARCARIEPCTIVMDLEGTDGSERGEDDTAFEKRSAVFALAVSDIVLINIWCNNIGLEQAGYSPLLKTAFQVMLRLFSPRKTTLMFVIRDKSKIPLEKLEIQLREGIQKIWNSTPKSEVDKHTPLSRFFNVEVVALSSYEDREEQFKEQVASLRQKFLHSTTPPDGLVCDRQGVFSPASAFSFSTQKIWKDIKKNKDLDLPAHKVMGATVRCDEISNDIDSSFRANQEWLDLKEAAQSHLEPSFRNKVTSLIQDCLSRYDKEATYFEVSVRSAKRNQLEEKLFQHVQPANQWILEHIQSVTLENFKKALSDALNRGQGYALAASDSKQKFERQFDEQCEVSLVTQANWGLAITREKFLRELDSHLTQVRTVNLSELTTAFESELKEALSSQVEALLRGGSYGTWDTIRELLDRETRTVVPEFSSALSSIFYMNDEEKEDMVLKLKIFARRVVEDKAREQTKYVLLYMSERFKSIMQRIWTENKDTQAITETALSSAVNVLSVLAAIRLDEATDTIEDTLFRALLKSDNTSPDPLSSSEWEKVPRAYTLITPGECKSLWDRFNRETVFMFTQANVPQDANDNGSTNFFGRIWNFIRKVAAILFKHKASIATVLGMAAILLRSTSELLADKGIAGVLLFIAYVIEFLAAVFSTVGKA